MISKSLDTAAAEHISCDIAECFKKTENEFPSLLLVFGDFSRRWHLYAQSKVRQLFRNYFHACKGESSKSRALMNLARLCAWSTNREINQYFVLNQNVLSFLRSICFNSYLLRYKITILINLWKENVNLQFNEDT